MKESWIENKLECGMQKNWIKGELEHGMQEGCIENEFERGVREDWIKGELERGKRECWIKNEFERGKREGWIEGEIKCKMREQCRSNDGIECRRHELETKEKDQRESGLRQRVQEQVWNHCAVQEQTRGKLSGNTTQTKELGSEDKDGGGCGNADCWDNHCIFCKWWYFWINQQNWIRPDVD